MLSSQMTIHMLSQKYVENTGRKHTCWGFIANQNQREGTGILHENIVQN